MDDFRIVYENEDKTRKLLLVTYALLLLGWFTGGITALIAIIVCYVKRDEYRQHYLGTHIKWIIRTFWLHLVLFCIGYVLLIIWIGNLIILWAFIWNVVRIIKGALKLYDEKPMPFY